MDLGFGYTFIFYLVGLPVTVQFLIANIILLFSRKYENGYYAIISTGFMYFLFKVIIPFFSFLDIILCIGMSLGIAALVGYIKLFKHLSGNEINRHYKGIIGLMTGMCGIICIALIVGGF